MLFQNKNVYYHLNTHNTLPFHNSNSKYTENSLLQICIQKDKEGNKKKNQRKPKGIKQHIISTSYQIVLLTKSKYKTCSIISLQECLGSFFNSGMLFQTHKSDLTNSQTKWIKMFFCCL